MTYATTKPAEKNAMLDLSRANLSTGKGMDMLPKVPRVFETRLRARGMIREEDATVDLAAKIVVPFMVNGQIGEMGDFLVQHEGELTMVSSKRFAHDYEPQKGILFLTAGSLSFSIKN